VTMVAAPCGPTDRLPSIPIRFPLPQRPSSHKRLSGLLGSNARPTKALPPPAPLTDPSPKHPACQRPPPYTREAPRARGLTRRVKAPGRVSDPLAGNRGPRAAWCGNRIGMGSTIRHRGARWSGAGCVLAGGPGAARRRRFTLWGPRGPLWGGRRPPKGGWRPVGGASEAAAAGSEAETGTSGDAAGGVSVRGAVYRPPGMSVGCITKPPRWKWGQPSGGARRGVLPAKVGVALARSNGKRWRVGRCAHVTGVEMQSRVGLVFVTRCRCARSASYRTVRRAFTHPRAAVTRWARPGVTNPNRERSPASLRGEGTGGRGP
jgi:hypothetical protein